MRLEPEELWLLAGLTLSQLAALPEALLFQPAFTHLYKYILFNVIYAVECTPMRLGWGGSGMKQSGKKKHFSLLFYACRKGGGEGRDLQSNTSAEDGGGPFVTP